jgi:hypothetical protein
VGGDAEGQMTEEQRWPEPAYLTKDHAINMTLRDYAAIKAMQGFISNNSTNVQDIAQASYIVADAMLKEREKK